MWADGMEAGSSQEAPQPGASTVQVPSSMSGGWKSERKEQEAEEPAPPKASVLSLQTASSCVLM